MNLHVHVDGLDAWARRFQGADRIIVEELQKAGQRAGLPIEAAAKRYVPKDTKNLMASIQSSQETRGYYVQTKIGTKVPYARIVDEGRTPGKMPPPGVLRDWMRRHGFALGKPPKTQGGYYSGEFLLARAINRRKVPRPYLSKAFAEAQPRIRKEFALVPKRVIARLRGGA